MCRMERKKEGWFRRLIPFWKERKEQTDGERIGFFNEPEQKREPFAEMGAVASLTQVETRYLFGTVEEAAEKQKELLDAGDKEEKKYFSVPLENERRPFLISAKEEDAAEKKDAGLFREEIFWKEERPEKESAGKGSVFLRELELESETRSVPAVEKSEDHIEMRETAETTKKETQKKAEPTVDIEKLMRQITERLWEEREGCGRKLR